MDLSTGKVSRRELPKETRELFLGGRLISTRILWDELAPGTDPLSPDNLLIVMTSPLTGTGAPSSSRYDISAKSPLTGCIGHSNSGGDFGINLKKAGWDGLIIRGRAESLVFIDINEDKVEIKDAAHLAGKNTQETQELLGRGGKMVIGPSGENMVKYATIVSQERSHGRTGMGTVMGSKNLKAVLARGNRKIELHDPEAFRAHIKKWVEMLRSHPATSEFAPKYGTSGFLQVLSDRNAMPTKNFNYGSYKDAHLISGHKLAADYLVRNYGCVSCPVKCGRVVRVGDKEVKGPELETCVFLGSNILCNDMEAIIQWNYELDLLGLDSISAGNVLGFAAELSEKGLWKSGIEFGRKDNILQVFRDIAYRRGIGDDLAEGVRFLSGKYGGGDFAAQTKGLELPAYEPRGAVGHGLGYATSNRGGCHLHGGYMIYFEVNGPLTLKPTHHRSKPGWVVMTQNLMAAIGAGGNCLFTAWTFLMPPVFKLPGHKFLSSIATSFMTYSWWLIDASLKLPPACAAFHIPFVPQTKALELATGMTMNLGAYLEVGERGYNLERLFNLREGITKAQDSLPKRFTHVPLVSGKNNTKVPLKKMLPKYYKLRGWDKDGIPTDKTLRRLKLFEIAEPYLHLVRAQHKEFEK